MWAYNQFFNIHQNESYSVTVTSPQRRVCLCYEVMVRDCSVGYFPQKSVYLGEPFQISAAVVGQLDGIVSRTVYAELKQMNNIRQELSQGEDVQ